MSMDRLIILALFIVATILEQYQGWFYLVFIFWLFQDLLAVSPLWK